MVSVEEAQVQAQQARQILEQKRREAEEAKQRLKEQEAQIQARVTQSSLRSGELSGLEGRKQRMQLQGVSSQLRGQQQQVEQYKGELSKFEQEQLKPFEKEISDYETRKASIEKINKAASQGKLWAYAAYGTGYEKELAKELLKQQNIQKLSFDNQKGVGVDVGSIPQKSAAEDLYGRLGVKQIPFQTGKDSYDVGTKTYTSPEGYKYSIAQKDIPIGTKIISDQKFSLTEPTYSSPQQKELMNILETKSRQYVSEIKRYEDLGYSKSQAQKLASSSVSEGGKSYSEKEAEKIIIKGEGLVGVAEAKLRRLEKSRLVEVTYSDGTKGYISPEQAYREQVRKKSFKELAKEGDIPAIVLKTSQKGGELFFGGTEKIRTRLLGGTTLSKQQQRLGGEIVGEAGLWGFASPIFATGTAAVLEQDVSGSELIYDYVKKKWVRINKLTGEIKEVSITPQEFISTIKQDIVEKTAGKEQIKYLDNLYKKFFKDKPQGKEAFQKIVRDLYNSGEFKGIPIELLQKEKASEILTEIAIELPYMRGAGVTGAVTSSQSQLGRVNNPFFDVSQVKDTGRFQDLTDTGRVSELGKGKDKFSELTNVLSGSRNKEVLESALRKVSKTREGQGLMAGLLSVLSTRQMSGQAQKSGQMTKQGQKTAQSTAQAFKQALGLKQAQRQVQRQQYRQQQIQRARQIPKRPIKMRIPLVRTFLSLPKKQQKAMIGEFTLFTRKKGKDIKVGTARTEKEAFGKLFKQLGGTLRAGGYIEDPFGRKVKPRNLPSMFATGKRESYRVIEKRKYRLDVPEEITEIMGYPKSKAKKIKIKWW